LDLRKLYVEILPRGTAWLDTGTPENLLSAASYVKIIEERQGYKIACLEEIALRKGWLTSAELKSQIEKRPANSYNDYIRALVEPTV
jgi:glucose-1-phosphate thymidylyltransferase